MYTYYEYCYWILIVFEYELLNRWHILMLTRAIYA